MKDEEVLLLGEGFEFSARVDTSEEATDTRKDEDTTPEKRCPCGIGQDSDSEEQPRHGRQVGFLIHELRHMGLEAFGAVALENVCDAGISGPHSTYGASHG